MPLHTTPSSLTRVRSRELIRRILLDAGCYILKEKPGPKRTIKIEAEKLLKKGRIHVKASCQKGNYEIDVHLDSEIHRIRPRPTRSRAHYSKDCKEVRLFLNRYVIPLILQHRDHFHRKKNDHWLFCNTLLEESENSV